MSKKPTLVPTETLTVAGKGGSPPNSVWPLLSLLRSHAEAIQSCVKDTREEVLSIGATLADRPEFNKLHDLSRAMKALGDSLHMQLMQIRVNHVTLKTSMLEELSRTLGDWSNLIENVETEDDRTRKDSQNADSELQKLEDKVEELVSTTEEVSGGLLERVDVLDISSALKDAAMVH